MLLNDDIESYFYFEDTFYRKMAANNINEKCKHITHTLYDFSKEKNNTASIDELYSSSVKLESDRLTLPDLGADSLYNSVDCR